MTSSKHRPKQGFLELDSDAGRIRITVLGPRVVRVQAFRDGIYRRQESFSRVPYREQVETNIEEGNSGASIKTKEFELIVETEPFGIRLQDRSGQLIFETVQRQAMMWQSQGFQCRMRMLGDEHFYGMGEKAKGLNRRGFRYEMWNEDFAEFDTTSDSRYQSCPFFIVLRKGLAHGVFLDNTYRTFFDFGKESSEYYSFGAPGGPLDYYIILGPAVSDVVDCYTRLTGRPCFIPRWGLGYQQSRFLEYSSEEDLITIASELRKRRIPCDVIVLDIEYMDEYRIFTWDPTIFPSPKEFVSRLSEMGFRVMSIIDPGIKRESGFPLYDRGKKEGFLLKKSDGSTYVGLVWPGETVFPDFSRSEVREWFASQYSGLAETGLSNGSWIDMNEPSNCIYDGLKDEYSMKAVIDQNGEPWEPKLRNVYALGMAEAAFEGVKRAYPGKRPFILTRSGFSGYQRFAATWTGDNHSTWEHLWLSIPMLLNLGLSGVPFCGADVGGFGGNATPELLARWYQLGCFYPFFRNHSNMNTAKQEPWVFGDEVERVSREGISLRYHLLRYIYSLAWCASRTGIPLMRPVFLDFQEDEKTWDIDNQFMVGPFVLVAPVVEEGMKSREVYLPSCSWFDFWSDDLIEGPSRFMQDAPLDRVPIYVRGGASIPAGRVIQNSDEEQGDLLLLVYPLGDSEFTLYEDDGISQDGPCSTVQFRVESSGKLLHVEVGARSGSWNPAPRSVVFEFRGMQNPPTTVSVDRRNKNTALVKIGERRYSLALNDDGKHHDIQLEWK